MWIHVGVPECPLLFWGHFDLDLWHISYIIGGRNPKFSVWIHLGVAECHTLFIDHYDLKPGLIYDNLLSLWALCCHIVTQFMFLPDNQLSNSAIQGYLYRWYNPFLALKKRLNCIKSISTFSLSTQHAYREKQSLLLPKVANLYLMTVPVFEFPCTTSNMYVVHGYLMKGVLYLLYLRSEFSGHLIKTV